MGFERDATNSVARVWAERTTISDKYRAALSEAEEEPNVDPESRRVGTMRDQSGRSGPVRVKDL